MSNDNKLHNHWADALRVERHRQRLTQKEVGQLLGVTASAVTAWECASTFPCRRHYDKLCELFPALRNVPKPSAGSQHKDKPGRRAEPQLADASLLRPITTTQQQPVCLPQSADASMLLGLLVEAGCSAQQIADVAAKLMARVRGTGGGQ